MSENLLVSREGRLARLTLNRPEKRNALDQALCKALLRALADLDGDSRAGAILLDGNGPVFCSGMDLSEVLESDAAKLSGLHAKLFSVGMALKKPLVAAVHGAALAGGLGLALNAHVIVAAADARFGLTERKIGLWPYTIFEAVVRAAGARRATELALTARTFDAGEAARLGLVDRVVPPAELARAARSLATELSVASAAAMSKGLAFAGRISSLSPAETRKLAIRSRTRAQESADFQEGVRAFREKRDPVWPSHKPS